MDWQAIAATDAKMIAVVFPGELVQGAKGEAVSAVQWKLVAVGHEVKVDGDFGKKTAAAVVGVPDDARPHRRRPRRQDDLDRARTASRVTDPDRDRATRVAVVGTTARP